MRCIGECGRDYPAIYLTAKGLCEDCRIATFIPRGYQTRERYKDDQIAGHLNATRKPKTGILWMDQVSPMDRVCEAVRLFGVKVR